ncbi:hypothetical protein KVT40_003042 [Elsinoe batatas]|uniref:Uncharacterized protein n=1 Tax=Elsinoe batatas TaxID=2601811 RepID=A0A8K0PI49_9PEZI|nr:hypothetical protein KVT40_003042 [Elsinoe batatas]
MKIPYATILFVLGTAVEAKKKKKSKPKIGGSNDDSTTTTTSYGPSTATTKGNPLITLYGFGNKTREAYSASVVRADPTGAFMPGTTLAVSCPTTQRLCPGGTMNITQSQSSIMIQATASTTGVSVSYDYKCMRIGTLLASCRETRVVAAANGTGTFSTYSQFDQATLGGVPYALVEITAGREKLPSGTADQDSLYSGAGRISHTGNSLDGMWLFMTAGIGMVAALAFLL